MLPIRLFFHKYDEFVAVMLLDNSDIVSDIQLSFSDIWDAEGRL